MRLRNVLVSLVAACLLVLGHVLPAAASRAELSAHTWDQGLKPSVSRMHDRVDVTGKRVTRGAWGTGPVNYQAGATVRQRAGSSGALSVRMEGTNCSARYACSYGSGTGYKGLVQFWNDPQNYIAFGLINDPGVSPRGVTVMIEGAAQGKPVGGYWPAGAITGSSHVFDIEWTKDGITWTIDGQTRLGPYRATMTNPSISFLGAARQHTDAVHLAFENIRFADHPSAGPRQPIATVDPYADISATIQAGGSGTGYNSMINIHDAHDNAIAFGIQADVAEPKSKGQPWFMYNRVQNGTFTYEYLAPASSHTADVAIRWWRDGRTVLVANGKPIAEIDVHMRPRLFFQAEGDARKNGDTLDSWVRGLTVEVGDKPGETGLNGAWNTEDPGFHNYGLKARNTNGVRQNGADFHISGTVRGVPGHGDWDSHPVYAVGMIAQYWHGK